MKRLKNWLRRLIEIIRKPEIGILPGQMSFFLVLSAIPIITLLIYAASLFAFDIEDILEAFSSFLPQNLLNMLSHYLSNNNLTVGMGLTLLFAFTLASNGPYSMIVASNTLYKVEKSDYIRGRLKAFLMTILLVSLFVFTLVFLAFGNSILSMLFKIGFFKQFESGFLIVYNIIKWPISMFIIFLAVKLLYTMAPDKEIKSKYVNKGAIFTTTSWMLIANIYSFYAMNFSRYDAIYGNLSTIVTLMMVIYIFSYLFVIGIAINASFYQYKDETEDHNNNG